MSTEIAIDPEKTLSYKRYFINNLDSYHGEYILAQIHKHIEEKVAEGSRRSSTSVLGEDAEPKPYPPPPAIPYEIIGTVTDTNKNKIDHVTRVVPKDSCLPQMLTCGTVILDISYDRDEIPRVMEYLKLLKLLLEAEAEAVAQSTPKTGDADDAPPEVDADKKRYLILISTVMTWALTKPLDPESPDMPFIETDFRKRKSHPNYKAHYHCENEVIGIARKFRYQIGATVVGAGLTYGGKEDALAYWFQKAWECERFIPIMGRGVNAVPLVNVADLSLIIYNLIRDFPRKLYMLAVEQQVAKQREIIKALGRSVGTGMFKCIPPDDAFLIPEITQRIFDLMNLNLYLEPTYIVETMDLQWTSDLTFTDNISFLMKQYRQAHKLKAFKVLVYGPPMVGKSALAKLICDNYGLVYISPETVVEDLIEDLSWRIEHWEVGELVTLGVPLPEFDEISNGGGDEEDIEAARTTYALLKSGRPPTDEEIVAYLRKRLLSKEAQNRGYVLDGFPTNLSQCTSLFEKGEEQEAVAEEEREGGTFEEDAELYASVLKRILPDLVVSLDATDDFVCEKAMRQPESSGRVNEEMILKRLSEFRAGDTRELTPLNFFDELDIHPLVIPVTNHQDYSMNETYKAVALRMGRASSYSKLLERLEAKQKQEQAEMENLRNKEEKALRDMEKKLKEEREEKMEYWSELYALMREEEEAALAAAGEPMRNYLVHHIFPTLTPALLEVARMRPDDPIDFLAEYLFKLNPSGKMLEPGYNLQAEKLLGKIKLLDEAMHDLDLQIEPFLPPEAVDDTKDDKFTFRDMSNF